MLGMIIFQSASIGIQQHQPNVWESKMIWQNISYWPNVVVLDFPGSRTWKIRIFLCFFFLAILKGTLFTAGLWNTEKKILPPKHEVGEPSWSVATHSRFLPNGQYDLCAQERYSHSHGWQVSHDLCESTKTSCSDVLLEVGKPWLRKELFVEYSQEVLSSVNLNKVEGFATRLASHILRTLLLTEVSMLMWCSSETFGFWL